MKEFLNTSFWGNSLESYLICLGIIVAAFVLIRIFRTIVLGRLKKWSERTNTNIDNYLIRAIERSVLPILNIAAVYAALNYLTLSARADKIMKASMAVVITYFAVKLITSAIEHALLAYLRRQERGEEKQRQVRGIMIVVKIFIWVIGLVFLLDNLGFDVTAAIAGLGIGGIAIALASQAILGDLFSYFVIFFDRPFEIGDFIVVDDKNGIIENVGIKTTRIKTLSGEQLVVSNTDLTNSRIHNYKKMTRRRIVFTVRAAYNTPLEKIKIIPGIIKDAILSIPGTTFDRSHFSMMSEYSLDFESVYYVESPDYTRYMDCHQAINLYIFRRFLEENIEFAYPSKNIFIKEFIQNEPIRLNSVQPSD
ncbi:MAG TPA: mechanosensitive ion channel domain-containing protein [Parasegetibacter sp.]